MSEFKPNPFKIAWEELIVKKIIDEIQHDFFTADFASEHYPDLIEDIVKSVIIRYKEETAKQKGLKE